MKRIALTKGKEALVDDQDYEYLMQWKWKASHNRNTFYANACTSRTYPGGRQYFSMHRLVAAQIGFPLGDKVVGTMPEFFDPRASLSVKVIPPVALASPWRVLTKNFVAI
jgi:hypothetical protein